MRREVLIWASFLIECHGDVNRVVVKHLGGQSGGCSIQVRVLDGVIILVEVAVLGLQEGRDTS